MQGEQVWSLVGEPRSHMPCDMATYTKRKKKEELCLYWGFSFSASLFYLLDTVVTLCVCVCESVSRVQLFVTPQSPPDSSVLEILQARILEWVAISFSRESSWPRVQTRVSCIAGRCFTIWDTRQVGHSSASLLESLETDLQSPFHNDTRHYDKHAYVQTAPDFILFSCSCNSKSFNYFYSPVLYMFMCVCSVAQLHLTLLWPHGP